MQNLFLSLLTRAAWLYLYCVGKSSKIIWRNLEIRESLEKKEKNFIYAFWHGRQLIFPWAYRNKGAVALVSKSKDGDIIARVIHLFGLGTVRGSSSKGGRSALVQLAQKIYEGKTIGFTPDGPRGPQREVAPGILYIAQKTAKPILPLTYSAKYKIIIRGWDNYWVPLPFNTFVINYGKPIEVRREDNVTEKAKELQQELNRITQDSDQTWDNRAREKIYYLLYNLFLKISSPFILLGFLFQQPKRFFSQFFIGLGMRTGNMQPLQKETIPIWIHAASLGECRAAYPFIKILKEEFPHFKILFTSNTVTGLEEAARLSMGDFRFLAPLDFPFILKRFFKIIRPKIFFMVESEIWPNRLRLAKKYGIKICLINGRISEKSTRNYLLSKTFSKIILENIDLFCVREDKDLKRFLALGVPPEKINITGNLKLDYFYFQNANTFIQTIEEKNPFEPLDTIWTAASIRKGEEKIVLETYLSLKNKFPKLKLILAPRHLEEVEFIRHLLILHRLSFCLKTEFKNFNPHVEVIIWNSYGDLLLAYQWSHCVFMGGSLVPIGGHNPIEPAYFGKAVLFGPHMENFSEIAHWLKDCGGALQIKDGSALTSTLENLLKEKGKIQKMGNLSKEAMGTIAGISSKKTMDFIRPVLRKIFYA